MFFAEILGPRRFKNFQCIFNPGAYSNVINLSQFTLYHASQHLDLQ